MRVSLTCIMLGSFGLMPISANGLKPPRAPAFCDSEARESAQHVTAGERVEASLRSLTCAASSGARGLPAYC